MKGFEIIEVSEQNAHKESLFCIKNPKYPGFNLKLDWLKKRWEEGLKLKVLKHNGQIAGFIEYVPAEYAWRPVTAPGFYFIHCIWVYPKKHYQQGFASALINHCLDDAANQNLKGLAVQVSKGSWMASPDVFLKNGFQVVDSKDRFQLLVKYLQDADPPKFNNWENNLSNYTGLNLIYANQCPMLIKSVDEMKQTATSMGLTLNVKVLESAKEAQNAPSGYGVYSLVYNGKIYADHYISNTRFRNILTKELNG